MPDNIFTDEKINNSLEDIFSEVQRYYGLGRKASYIPALYQVDARQFAMTLIDKNGKVHSIGDDKVQFSIQSVSKVLSLTMVLNEFGEEIWGRMEREPSGKSFDSLIHLEEFNGIPSNPLINSGAIVMADILLEHYRDQAVPKFIEFCRMASGNDNIKIDEDIYKSEKRTAHKNFAFAHYIKSFGNINNDVESVIDTYLQFCSVTMSNIDLARCFYYLSNEGVGLDGKQITSRRHAKRINSIMFTCGTYDEVGDFAYLVGLPVKSGVSGAITGSLPGQYSISVWSPELNKKGNSYLGFKALESLTTLLDKSYLS